LSQPVPDGGFATCRHHRAPAQRAEIRAAHDAAQEASRTIEAAYRN
jgi:hypothetical protein